MSKAFSFMDKQKIMSNIQQITFYSSEIENKLGY